MSTANLNGDDYSFQRKHMVDTQIAARGIRNPAVLNAMRAVVRHRFIPEELWEDAYSDYPLPIGQGQTISQPYIVALMTEQLALHADSRVLEVGTGSGYQTAILAEIAKEVISIETLPMLYERAKQHLASYSNVSLNLGNGALGYAEAAPYDAIIVTAAASKLPVALMQQLRPEGVMVLPMGETIQSLLRIKRQGTGYQQQHICDVRFVRLVDEPKNEN